MKPVFWWRMVFGALALALGIWILLSNVPQQPDETLKLKYLVPSALRLGATLALAGAGVLFILCPWWAGRRIQPAPPAQPITPSWFWPGVLLAMVIVGISSFPRLTHSLWDDEEYNVRYSIVGKYQIRSGDEPVKFHPVKWRDTFFEYREPNNHVLHSLLARACVDTWRSLARPAGLPFVEWPLRIPSLLAGLLSIAALAWFLKIWGIPGAGVLAAFLMALHPWHMRYSAECRGYAFVLLLVPLLLAFFRLALREGHWRWWAGLGVVQFALVYSYPGTAFVIATLNLLAVPAMAFDHSCAKPFLAQSGRWFCTNACSALPAVVLMMPLVPQMRNYLEYETSRNIVIGAQWMWNTLCHFILGVGWTKGSSAGAEYPEVLFSLGGQAWVYHVLLGVAGLLLFFGCLWFARKGLQGWMVVVATVLPPVVTVLFARYRGHLIYESYVLYALPGVVALVAVGAFWIVDTLSLQKSRIRIGLLVCFVGIFAALTQPTRAWMWKNSLEPIKESVIASRGSLELSAAANSPLITASFSIPPYLYDPHAVRLESPQQFVELLHKADAAGRPLIINLGMPWAAREYSPAMWGIVNESALFQPPETLRGLDPGLDRVLFRYKTGSATHFDFSGLLDKPR